MGGVAGNLYSSGGNWNPAIVPNGLSYDASIDNDTINVDISPTLNSLTIGGNGEVNVLAGSTLTLGSPSTPGAVVLNNGGTLNVNDGGTLALASSSDVTINNSTLTLNASSGNSSLLLNSGGSGVSFILTGGALYTTDVPNVAGGVMIPPSGNVITGISGAESLTNDYSHTIQGAGIIGGVVPGTTTGGLAGFTNLGTLSVIGSNALNVVAPLSSASWDSAGLNLIGGTYSTSSSSGGNIQLNLGGGNTIAGLTGNANVALNGALLTADGVNDALNTLNAITDSSLTISSTSETITPSGGTLAVSTSGFGGLSQASLNVSGGSLTVNGNLTNTALGNSSTIMLTNGASLSAMGGLTQSTDIINAVGPASTMVDNSTLTLGGTFTQLDPISTLSLANGATISAQGLNNQGIITVDSNSSADFRTGTPGGFVNLQNGVLTGGTYAISGNLYYDADPVTGGGITALAGGANIVLSGAGQMLYGGSQTSPGSGMVDLTNLSSITDSNLALLSSTLTNISGPLTITTQSGSSSLLIDGGNLTIGGGLTMTSAAPSSVSVVGNSSVTVQDVSTLTVAGLYSQGVNTLTSVLDANGIGSQLYAQGFSNLGEIDVDPNSVADFRAGTVTAATGTFTNLTNGTLTGGTYNISGTLYYDANSDGGQITKLQNANVTLTGGGQMLYGGTSGSLSGAQALGSLSNITDSTLTLNNSTALTSVTGGLTINSVAEASSLNLNGTNFTVNGNLTANSTNSRVSTIDVRSGSALDVTGSVNLSGNMEVSGGSSLTAGGSFTLNSGALLSVCGSTNCNGGGTGSTVSAQGLTNNGSLFIAAGSTGDFRTGASGGFTNLSGGTLNGGSYDVAGTLLVDGGGINKIGSTASLTLEGTGSILSGGGNGNGVVGSATNALSGLAENDGALVLKNSANLTTGALVNDGSLTVNSASKLTTTGAFTNNGSLTLGGGATVGVAGLGNLSGGSLSGGTWNISGTLNYTAGSKITDIASGTNVTLNGAGAIKTGGVNALTTLSTLEGSLAVTGADTLSDTAVFTNNGTLTVGAGSTVSFTHAGGSLGNLSGGSLTGGTWNVGGTLNYTAGGNITDIAASTTVNLSGATGAIKTGGTNALSTLSTLEGNLSINQGDTLTTTSKFTNTGTLTVGGGSALTVNNALGNLTAGSLSGGTWDIAGTVNYTTGGSIRDIAAATIVDLIGPSGAFKTAGTNALAGLSSVEGELDISFGESLSTTASSFTNSGVVNVSGGPQTDSLTVAGQFINQGTVTVGAGDTLRANGANGYVQNSGVTYLYGMLTAGTVDIAGGSLFGTGTVSGKLINEAVVDPGDPGTLTIMGDYSQTSTGDLTLDVDGATPALYDNLAVGGNAGLNGTLDVNLESSFLSSIYNNETFRFLTFSGTLSGNFSNVEYSVDGNLIGNAAALDAAFDLNFSEQVNAHDITFEVQVTPEPGTWFLLGLGLMLAGGFEYRRRRSGALRIQ